MKHANKSETCIGFVIAKQKQSIIPGSVQMMERELISKVNLHFRILAPINEILLTG